MMRLVQMLVVALSKNLVPNCKVKFNSFLIKLSPHVSEQGQNYFWRPDQRTTTDL